MAKKAKKYVFLMEDREIKRWYDELYRSSVITAGVYFRRLGSFCNRVGTDPEKLLLFGDKEVTDLISDEISEMEKRGLAGSYISSTVSAVKSWLTYNNRKLSRKIKIKDHNLNPTLRNERVPMQEELKKILASGDPRARTACILMAYTGMRPQVMGNYLGDDGLKISDIPEMDIVDMKVNFRNVPTLIVVRPEISKARHQYMTFLGNEGCFILKAYMEERMNEGEKLTPESSIIAPAKLGLRDNQFIRTINVGDIVRDAIRKAGFAWRPYVLRAYFDTQLMMAESKGLILRDYRQFWMGHVGDIEHRYTINKQRLPENLIEEMRSAYSKALKFLETEQKGIQESEMNEKINDFKRMMLILAGYSNDDIDKNRMLDLSNEELAKKIDEKKAKSLNNGNSQKIVSMKEIREYIEKGWEFVQSINSREAIIRIPK